MKAATFSLARPTSLAEALAALPAPGTRIIAGGQSFGPMLNLRLARPAHLVAIASLPELGGASETPEAITLGACITHAAIADGRTPDLAGGILARVAENIDRWTDALALIDAKLEFYDEWMESGERPALSPHRGLKSGVRRRL